MKISYAALIIALGTGFVATDFAAAQEASDTNVVVTGTRVAKRTALDTAAPVDVISSSAITNQGTSELAQALSVSLPSLNFPRPSLTDGTDSVRPATLRGLAPDQTLVLVNSKRRHSSSLVNLNGSIGRGSSAVDLNTIPSSIISTVEVLRDGASAQYGSDAIAGVVNIRLKQASSGGGVTASYGEYNTTVDTDYMPVSAGAFYDVSKLAKYKKHDGASTNLSAWAGLPLGTAGFLTVAADYSHKEHTVRTAPDWRQQYTGTTATSANEVAINRYNAWYGDPDIDQYTVFANAGYDLSDSAKLYGWASYQNREALSAGYFRRSNDSRNVVSIYPDGFLPLISPLVKDASFGSGMQWKAGEWDMDLSLVGGYNSVDYTIKNTLNRSFGAASKTEFDAGGFDYTQLVVNLSGTRGYDVGFAKPLNVSTGIEARSEAYSIKAGEYESYANGGVLLNGSPTPSGSQVFPGFTPANETKKERNSIAGYVDLETNITEPWLVSAAIRGENYEGFGSTATGKLATRYDFSPNFAIRASVQNGFRAPSLQQIGFTATSTNFINGVGYEITTFQPDSDVAKALGAKPLKAEKSVNYALGAVARFGRISATVDAYQINLKDRIVLSENLTQTQVRNYLISQGFIGVGGGRFFINGVDTETKGLDLIVSAPYATDNFGKFNFTFSANFNDTKVTKTPTTPELASLGISSTGLFSRVNVLTFEKGTPKDKYSLNTDWTLDKFGATLRATRYGEVLSPGSTAAFDVVLEPKVVIYLEGRYQITKSVKLALGAENITDEYPTKTPYAVNSTSNTPFSTYGPFGHNGRYIYGRVSYSW